MTEEVKATIEKRLFGKSQEIQDLFYEVREVLVNHDPRLTESVKWGMLSYDFKTIVAGLGAFKNHVSIWFHKGAIMKDDLKLFVPGDNKEMRQIKFSPGDRINAEGIKVYLDEALDLNARGVKIKKTKSESKKTVDSSDFMDELVKNKEASTFFDSLTSNQKNNFTSYVEDAKQEVTKQKRIARSIERLSQGFKTTY